MVARTGTVWKLKRGIYEAVEVGEVEVSTLDTFVIQGLTGTAANPYRVAFWKMTDGMVVNSMYAEASPNCNRCGILNDSGGNPVTNCKCIYMAYGVKA